MKKRTILFFILLIAASLLLFIYTFSILAHTPERTGTAGLWVDFFMNLPCCILIGYADYQVAKLLQKRFFEQNGIRIILSISLTALLIGVLAVAILLHSFIRFHSVLKAVCSPLCCGIVLSCFSLSCFFIIAGRSNNSAS